MDAVIFDLDGTLWDTCESCAVGWNNVLERNGISYRAITAEDIRRVAGKKHSECIETVFHDLPASQQKLLCEQTMEEDNRIVREIGGHLYAGVVDGLNLLASHLPLGIVSNCQSGYIETFLDFSSLHDLFTDFECWGNTGESKGENLSSLIRRNNFTDPVYIGDTEGDLEAARHCDIPFIHAEYGFGELISSCKKVETFPALITEILGETYTDEN